MVCGAGIGGSGGSCITLFVFMLSCAFSHIVVLFVAVVWL